MEQAPNGTGSCTRLRLNPAVYDPPGVGGVRQGLLQEGAEGGPAISCLEMGWLGWQLLVKKVRSTGGILWVSSVQSMVYCNVRDASCRFVFSSNLKDNTVWVLIYDRLGFDLEDEQSLRRHTALHSLLPVTTELLSLQVERRKTTIAGGRRQ